MNLQQQIQKTIEAYELACKPENRNFDYCQKNNLHLGICTYTRMNNFIDLFNLIKSKNISIYIATTPFRIETKMFLNDFVDYEIIIKNPTILKTHKVRIKFLKVLLKK